MTTRKEKERPTPRSGWISSKPTWVSLTLYLSLRRPETGGLCWLLPPGETAGPLSGCWSMKSSLRHLVGGPTLCYDICPRACVGVCKHLISRCTGENIVLLNTAVPIIWWSHQTPVSICSLRSTMSFIPSLENYWWLLDVISLCQGTWTEQGWTSQSWHQHSFTEDMVM